MDLFVFVFVCLFLSFFLCLFLSLFVCLLACLLPLFLKIQWLKSESSTAFFPGQPPFTLWDAWISLWFRKTSSMQTDAGRSG